MITAPTMDIDSQKKALLLGVEKIEKSVKRASRITHQLLGHVKKQRPQFSEVDLTQLMQETLVLLKKEMEDKHIRIDWQLHRKKIFLWSDAYQIRQVLMNLLNNAIHAMGENGCITLSSCEIQDAVILEIGDNGRGIPRENLGKIFDPFFTTKSFDEGTGLGLFVVHKIMSDLAGEIEVNSTVGKGTCFTIKLPKTADMINLEDKDNKI